MDPVAHLLPVLERTPEVRLAVLFGSRARGTARKESDVDLGILLESGSPERMRQLEVELARAAHTRVDVVFLGTAPPQLRFEIAKGRLLLQREPHLWIAFKRDAMIDWWDWAPNARRIHQTMIERLRKQVDDGPA